MSKSHTLEGSDCPCLEAGAEDSPELSQAWIQHQPLPQWGHKTALRSFTLTAEQVSHPFSPNMEDSFSKQS